MNVYTWAVEWPEKIAHLVARTGVYELSLCRRAVVKVDARSRDVENTARCWSCGRIGRQRSIVTLRPST